MRKILMASATVGMMLTLAACGEKSSEDAARSNAQASAEALTPGEYETKLEVIKFEMPGAPAGMADQMRSAMTAAGNSKFCVTAENVQQMRDNMVRNAAQAPEGCTLDAKGSGDNIDTTVTCTSPVAMTTHVTGTPLAMTVASETTTPAGKVVSEMRVTTTRIGDTCSAGTPAAPTGAAPAGAAPAAATSEGIRLN